ncbi:hypothetical protein [Streptomyces sp. NPDC048560]|uniref:hypothetical protein n=1 Tax=Streptomyces sp. NPDC048560 TaxID=3155488 RepID=UPI003440B508
MDESPLHIPVEKLREVLDVLLNHVAQDADHVTVEREAFWSIPADEVYDVYQEPKELTIGMVSESWRNLEAMTGDNPRVVGYGLVWLAEVLRAIGDETVS